MEIIGLLLQSTGKCVIFTLKKNACGHFESVISANILPYGMSLYSAIFSPKVKTIGPTL
jgi:hypothetical protein